MLRGIQRSERIVVNHWRGWMGVESGGRGLELALPSFWSSQRRFRRAPRNTRRSVHKNIRRTKWREVRSALEYAKRFDVRNSTLDSLRAALLRLRWNVVKDQTIAEGVTAPLAMRDQYLCFEVATPEDYVEGTAVLKPEVLARHAQIRRKGWKLIVVNTRAWERAGMRDALTGGGPAEARIELLSRLLVRQAPFTPRRGSAERS